MLVPAICLALSSAPSGKPAGGSEPSIPAAIQDATIKSLIARHGEAQAARVRQGVEQVARRWWPADGAPESFRTFCEDHFLADPAALDEAAGRLEAILEQVDGHLHEVRRTLLLPSDLDTGPIKPVDRLLSNLDLAAHVDEDLFATRVAFLTLLNFPVHTLKDRLAGGASWDRTTWARSRLAERFASRVPAAVLQGITEALTAADHYIYDYNIWMDRLVDAKGETLFPEGLKLISHWGLRDELKSHYGKPGGLARQRLIQRVMERIVRQEIPAVAVNNHDVTWAPEANQVKPAPGAPAPPGDLQAREPDTRYRRLLDVYRAQRAADPYHPAAPTYIARRFEKDRQMTEKQVEALLVAVLSSPEVKEIGRLIARRLERPLEPFDIWYAGFTPRAAFSEEELDRKVAARYPDVAAFQADLPRLLAGFGFTPERARWLAERIHVDPSRGAGHAMEAVRREDQARLRTRIPAGGMNYKGYNIAIHELGHNCEQVFSLHANDHWLLRGVPNTAFTEALAFTFQNRDLELLGLGKPGPETERLTALNDLWMTYEIGGVALVDMGVWNWMYAHPEAAPAQLKEATLGIARDIWNRYFQPVFGVKDSELLAIYSHMINSSLYLPDYPMGHVIDFALRARLTPERFGAEFERITRQGSLTPDAWMRGAVGGPLTAEPLLAAAREALREQPE